jgi:signal transduction histidine kinase
MSVIALALALRQPWLGVEFAPGSASLTVAQVAPRGPAHGALVPGDALVALIVEDGAAVPLSGALRRVNPGTLPSWSDYDAFLDTIETLHAEAIRGHLRFELSDGREVTVIPAASRPIEEMPAVWLLWVLRVAVVVILVSGLIAFLPRDVGVLGIALAGFASAGTSFALLPLEGRELVMSAEWMRALHRTLWLTHAFYGCGLALALWHYPKRLPGHRLAWCLYPVFAIAWLAYFGRWFDDPVRLQGLVSVSGLLVIAGLLVAQWRAAPPRSSARRGVLWFCACIGGSLLWFTGFLFLPMTLREDPVFSTEWIEMGVFLSFVALAIGIYRERLFNVDRWLLRAWLLLLATFATMAMDLLLILFLGLDSLTSLLGAIAIIAWLYLPLRQLLWSRLWRQDDTARAQRLRLQALTLALNANAGGTLAARWQALLQSTFDPLQIETAASAVPSPALVDHGRALHVPPVAGHLGLRLTHAGQGLRGFGQEDVALADRLHRWMLEGDRQRGALRRGADEERARFAADLHDDVVPQLLTLIYRSSGRAYHEDLRALMPRLRAAIRAIAEPTESR